MTTPWIVAFVALWVLTLLLAVVVTGLLRRVTAVLERAEARVAGTAAPPDRGGLEPGSHVPPFVVRDDAGAPVPSEDLLASGGVVLFMDADCDPCQRLAEELAQVGDTLDGLPLVVVLREPAADLTLPPGVPTLYQPNREASTAFRNIASPQAFAVDAAGVVRERAIASRLEDLRRLAHALEEGGDAGVEPGDRSEPAERARS